MHRWQKIYETNAPHQAEIVKAVLIENEINAVVVNKKDSAYHLGNCEVLVSSENVIKSVKIINDNISFE